MSVYSDAVLATSPVAYWRFGEPSGATTADASGNGHAATLRGASTLGVAGLLTGDADTAIAFNGANTQGCSIASDAFLQSGAGARSIVLWVSPTAVTGNPAFFLWGTGAGHFCWIGLVAAAFRIYDGVTSKNIATGITATPQMLAAVYDGTNWTAYVNGVAKTPVAQTLSTTLGSTLRIGYDAGIFQNSSLNGTMDEAAVWNRALTAAEVENIYRNGLNLRAASFALSQAYTMDATGEEGEVRVGPWLLQETGQLILQENGGGLRLNTIPIPLTFPTAAQTLESVLRGHHTPVVRTVFLDGDLVSVTHVVPGNLLGGDVSMDRKREIFRQASVTIENTDETYSPINPSSLVWPGRIVRVERGAVVNGVDVYVALITGLLSKPAVKYGSGAVSFTLWSRLRLLDRQFPELVTFDTGTSLGTLIRDVCELGGLGASDSLYSIDHGGYSLQAPRTFSTSDNMLHALTEYLYDHGLDGPYDSGAGVITVTPFTDPTARDIAWTFAPGQFSVLTDLSWSIEERSPVIYNRQDVIGVAPDRYPVFASARDLNPTSPTYNPVDGSGPLGDIPAPPHISADIHTESVGYAVAFQMLNEQATADLPVNAQAVPIPLLSPRDVVRFAAGDLDITARLDSLNIPLGPGAMTLNAHGVRSLIAS